MTGTIRQQAGSYKKTNLPLGGAGLPGIFGVRE